MDTSWRSCRRACRAGAGLAVLAAGLAFIEPVRGDDPVIVPTADPVIAAAGDIACDPKSSRFNGGQGTSSSCRQLYVSNTMLDVLGRPNVDAILPLGDNQYYCGGAGSWEGSYALSWGRDALKRITFPVPGNHEYITSGDSNTTGCTSANAGAAGYFGYFGTDFGTSGDPSRGYYSYDIGSWHIIALNSLCSQAGGCSSSKPQGVWLRNDLAAHRNMCTLAYWHVPLFSSGGRASSTYRTFWEALYEADADVVLNSHDHTYERFAPQTPTGQLDRQRGIRQWVVGTGGANHTRWSTIAPNSEVRNNKVYGVLKLTLRPTSYAWEFEPEARDRSLFSDEGEAACHGSEPDTTPPTTPTDLTAQPVSAERVDLAWSPSTDDSGSVRYSIFRDGVSIASTASTTYSDTTVAPETSYLYTVRAEDGAGNVSAFSNEAAATTPAAGTEKVLEFIPTADAWVEDAAPSANHGSASVLEVDKSPLRDGLLRFVVTGVGTDQVLAVRLQVSIANSSSGSTTLQVYPAAAETAWEESTVTWSTAPAADLTRRLAALGPTSTGSTHVLDLGTDFVSGDGTYTLRLISGSSDGTEIGSREAVAAQRPVLMVTVPG